MANTSNNAESYKFDSEYSKADILSVCKLEDEEQQRRIGDKEGENNKRVLALQMSEMFEDNMRSTWFQRGSSFVLSLLGNVRSKAGDIGLKATENLQAKAEGAGLLAKEQVHNIGAKAQEAAKDASNIISHKVESAGQAVQEQAHAVSTSIAHKVEDINLQTKATAANFTHNIHENALAGIWLAQVKARDAKSLISEKVQEYALKLKDAVSLSFSKTINTFSARTNLSFAIMEQEAERARRMNSSEEVNAIKNAMKVAALIKGLSPSLYRPASEPNTNYSTRLLEEAERARRIYEVKFDNNKAGIDNAKSVSNLINQKFSNPAPTPFPIAESKVEPIEAPTAKKSFAAAM